MVQQLHNARYQSGEAIIRYRFHPRYGEAVIVAGRNRHGDEVALIIRQLDGTLVQLPIWMTEDRAEVMMVTESPRLSLTYLRELRLELDACLTLLRDDSRCEGGDKHEASSILSPPTRSLCAQDPAGTDSTGRADEAIATGERAAVGSTRRSRSDGGR
ncbi:hypothetical protein EOA33_05160 [Mesorhizobium sp. M4A.F.Ca.ET.050.02.1.1]|uniref:hypothetical protein n=1 Tax=Mesorhizobium sp. M4A.F.Ca.ET.050.02.1.1 TaxID=2496754 RepID=UPI000FCC1DE7|nr:hypothetical protein [Mesorhizobium sp. M4A.F.Ca.ET.050.02.1.1]RUX51742.1 hypothetical protein EOA33_05160 [Mesorhizobium sp. M4A.F.Ca.ET.050.02.1.1]